MTLTVPLYLLEPNTCIRYEIGARGRVEDKNDCNVYIIRFYLSSLFTCVVWEILRVRKTLEAAGVGWLGRRARIMAL